MNLRLLFCIAMGVFTAHLGVFMLIGEFKPKPRFVPRPKPNFSAVAQQLVDAETGEKVVYREITVSTKFAPAPATPPPEKPALAELPSDDSAAPRP